MLNLELAKKLKSFTYLLPITFLLTACVSPPKPKEILQCDQPEIGYLAESSEQLDISVNIDGSASMIGYVTIDNSNYIRTIEAIERVIDPNSNNIVTYNRIADNENQNKDSRLIRDARSASFYSNIQGNEGILSKYKPVTSQIQKAVKPPSEKNDKLTIIITDLEGNDGRNLSDKIRSDYFNSEMREQGYTVGIWAIKSQFKGDVFDPPTGTVKFEYDTRGRNQEEYRPFYVLFIGKYNDIANYFDQINKIHSDLVSNNKSEIFIFPASNIFKQGINLGSFRAREKTSKLPENNQLQRAFSLEDVNIAIETEDDNIPYELLEIFDSDADEPNEISIEYQVNFPLLNSEDKGGKYALEIDPKELRFKTKVFTVDRNKLSNQSKSQSQSQSELERTEEKKENKPQEKQFFSLDNNSPLEKTLTLDVLSYQNKNQILDIRGQINLDDLNNSEIHLFEVDLILDNMEDPSWWQDWDYDKGNRNSNDGSKTEKISVFMKKLEQLSLNLLRDDDRNPVIGRFCFAIQKRFE